MPAKEAPSANSTFLPCAPGGSIDLTNSGNLTAENYWDCGRQYGQYYAKKNFANSMKSSPLLVISIFFLFIGQALASL